MAHARRIRTHVDSDTLTLRDLGDFLGQDVEVIVLAEEGAPVVTRAKLRRPLGLYRGEVTISGDLDGPLPPEVQQYFEGESDESRGC